MGKLPARAVLFCQTARLQALSLLILVLPSYAQESSHVFFAAGTNQESISEVIDPLQQDSLALVAIFESTAGERWRQSAGWLTGKLRSGEWQGVEVRDGRVVALNLAGNKLSGTLPREVGNLSALEVLSLDGNLVYGPVPTEITRLERLTALFLAGNELTSLPSFERMTRLLVVDVCSNRLNFDDLTRNRDLGDRLRYESQKPFGDPRTLAVAAGQQMELTIPEAGTGNEYTWFKDGQPISSLPQLVIPSVRAYDAGSYHLEITSTAFPQLTLMTSPVTVRIDEGLDRGDGAIGIKTIASNLNLTGDIQLRAEADRYGESSDGTPLDDEDRLLLRLRLGLEYDVSSRTKLGARLRTRSSSPSASHVILGDNLDGKDIGIDQVFAEHVWRGGGAWAGKKAFPFWTQNEILWDRDLSPEGVAAYQSLSVSNRMRGSARVAYFLLQDEASGTLASMTRLAGAQLDFSTSSTPLNSRAALSFYSYSHNADVVDERLGDRNYEIGIASVRVNYVGWQQPISLGADIIQNFQDYAVRNRYRNERTAFSIFASVGELGSRWSWRVQYSYSYVEKLSVAAGYAGDDRVRWTSGTYSSASNYRGHDVYGALAVSGKSSIAVRLMTASPIVSEPSDTSESGSGLRMQLDWNVRF